jgi:hypothetical protein
MRILQWLTRAGIDFASVGDFVQTVTTQAIKIGAGLHEDPPQGFVTRAVQATAVFYRLGYSTDLPAVSSAAADLGDDQIPWLWSNAERLSRLYGCEAFFAPPSPSKHTNLNHDNTSKPFLQAFWHEKALQEEIAATDDNFIAVLTHTAANGDIWSSFNKKFNDLYESNLVGFHYDLFCGLVKVLHMFHHMIRWERQPNIQPTITLDALGPFVAFMMALPNEQGFTWDTLWRAIFEPDGSKQKVIIYRFVAMLCREIERTHRVGITWGPTHIRAHIALLGSAWQNSSTVENASD